ncbi:MAG: hypothetical protein SGJ18_11675 [Pseudomonadota bacterium]|nr:hypothetical protein [Pseudomonadota bacterium]
MKRVMLVVEEPKESQFLESLLRKLKFDIEVIKISFMDKYLSFRPEVIFVTAKGKKISGIEIAKRINGKGEGPKIFLVVSPLSKLKPQDLMNVNVSGYVETPINPIKVIELLSHHCHLDAAVLRENLNKALKGTAPKAEGHENTFVKSKENVSHEKSSKYVNSKFLNFQLPDQTHISREIINKKMEDIRKEKVPDDFDEKRQEFVMLMFKQK